MSLSTDVLEEKEPKIYKSLNNLSKIFTFNNGLLKSFQREHQYYDEPKFWYFSSAVNNNFLKHDGINFHAHASGFSFFSEKEAILKCLAESIERYCNFVYFKENISFSGNYQTLIQKGKMFIHPDLFARFTNRQMKKEAFKKFNIKQSSVINWTTCYSLGDGKEYLIPCQYIYLSYPLLKKEPILYTSISTGVAGGSCLSAALVRGIYEIIERDAFMIYYFNKIPASRITLETIKNRKIIQLLQIAKRYSMKIICMDIATDIGVPVIASIVIDRSGIGKAISVGLKSNLDYIEAIIGSISEAFHTRGWIRSEHEKNQKKIKRSDIMTDSSLFNRGMYWYQVESIKKLYFWINSKKKKKFSCTKVPLTSGAQLNHLITLLNKFGYVIYWKDLMTPTLRKYKCYVVKVIIPQMQPLFLNEKYPLFGGERLYNVPKRLGFNCKTEQELNTDPHPFL